MPTAQPISECQNCLDSQRMIDKLEEYNDELVEKCKTLSQDLDESNELNEKLRQEIESLRAIADVVHTPITSTLVDRELSVHDRRRLLRLSTANIDHMNNN
ncbi:hypothetical protein PCE1_004951 [Barthelona sp. PCE]